MTPAAPWRAQFVALAAIWGSSFLFIKVGVGALAPVDVALARCALGAAALVAILAVRRLALPRGAGLWTHLGLAAVLFNSLPFTLFAYGETRISSVLAGIWNATTPLLTAVVALALIPQERLSRARAAGLGLGFAGVVVVLGPWERGAGGDLVGQALCLGAAACYGLGFAHARRALVGRPESGVALATGQLLWATAQLAVVTIWVGGAPGAIGLDVVGSLLALGALGSGVAYVLNFAIIRAAGATTASTVTYLIPLFSTVLGVAVLGEGLTWHQPVGAAVVLLGVAVAQGLVGPRAAAQSSSKATPSRA